MQLLTIKFFEKLQPNSRGISATDFRKPIQVEKINPTEIESISQELEFHTPLTYTYIGNYGIVTMKRGVCYYLAVDEFNEFRELLAEVEKRLNREEFTISDPFIENMAVHIDEFIGLYGKPESAGTYSKKLRAYLANELNKLFKPIL